MPNQLCADAIQTPPCAPPLRRRQAMPCDASASVVQARSIDEWAGCFDGFLRSGGRSEALSRLYRQIGSDSASGASALRRALRFDALRRLADAPFRHLFGIEAQCVGDARWRFDCTIAGRTVCRSTIYSGALGGAYACLCAMRTCHEVEDRLHALGFALDVEQLVRMRLDTMSDEPAVRAVLHARCRDPAFGATHLRGLHQAAPLRRHGTVSPCFVARFDEAELRLSDASSEGWVFRGLRLRHALTTCRYDTLFDLCAADALGAADPRLLSLGAPLRRSLARRIGEAAMHERAVRRLLARQRVCRTTLGELFGLACSPPGRGARANAGRTLDVERALAY